MNRTRKAKHIFNILNIIHISCLFSPITYFLIKAFKTGTQGQKLALSIFIVVSLCLSILALITEAKTRGGFAKTILWLLLLGITVCLTEVKNFIIIMAIISIVDELFIINIRDHFREVYKTNKEIDKRLK